MRGATDEIYLAITQCLVGTIDREDQLDRYIKALALKVSQFGCSQGREVGVRNQIRYRKFHRISIRLKVGAWLQVRAAAVILFNLPPIIDRPGDRDRYDDRCRVAAGLNSGRATFGSRSFGCLSR